MKDNKRLSTQVGPDEPSVASVQSFYQDLESIYEETDLWHQVTHAWVSTFISDSIPMHGQGGETGLTLNLGSAGITHGLDEASMVHADIVPKGLRPGRDVIGDGQRLAMKDESFDCCLCVGSVLNHCDAARLISESARVLRPGGSFILEFETSSSLELLGAHGFGKQAAIVVTFYQGHSVRLWAYSEEYVCSLLAANGLHVRSRSSKHHLSPLVYLLGGEPMFAARFHWFDRFLSKVPFAKRFCSNVIYCCEKAP